MQKIKCKYCGKLFEKKSYQQKFCCPRCKQKYWDKVKPDRHKDPLYYDKYNEKHGRYFFYDYDKYDDYNDNDDWGIYSFYDDPYYQGSN